MSACVLLVTSLLLSSSAGQIRMVQEELFFSGNAGETVEISCQSQEYPDECRFYRPDKKLVCENGDEEESYSSSNGDNDQECFRDPKVQLLPLSAQCQLRINSVDPSVHYGVWTCEATSWDKTGVAKVTLMETQAAEVEFVDVWGRVVIEMGKSPTFPLTCKASAQGSSAPLAAPPGEMTWKVGGQVVQKSRQFTTDKDGHFIQTYVHAPSTEDNEKKVECSLMQGRETKSDQIELSILLFDSPSENSRPVVADEGKPVTVVKSFRAFPKPSKEQAVWILDTPNGEKTVKPGEEMGRFEAGEIKELGENRYRMTLKIKKVANWDKSAKHRLSIQFEDDSQSEPRILPVNLDVRSAPKEPEAGGGGEQSGGGGKPTFAPPALPDTGLPEDEEAENTSDSSAPVAKATSSGVSLYIIVGIVALVVVLCALFYCTRCWRKKQQQEAEENGLNGRTEDVERPLIEAAEEGKVSGASGAAGQEKKHEAKVSSMKDPEKDLLSRLEPENGPFPKTPVRTVTIQEEKELEDRKSLLLPKEHPTANDENNEISKMVDTIRQLSTGGGHEEGEPLVKEENVHNRLHGASPIAASAVSETPVGSGSPSDSRGSMDSLKADSASAAAKMADDKNWQTNPVYRKSTDEDAKPPQSPAASNLLAASKSSSLDPDSDGTITNKSSDPEANRSEASEQAADKPKLISASTKPGQINPSKEPLASKHSINEGTTIANSQATPPASPASTLSLHSNDGERSWQTVDDTFEPSKILEQVEELLGYVKSSKDDQNYVNDPSYGLSPPLVEATGRKSPTMSNSSTQTPLMKHRDEIKFDAAPSGSSSSEGEGDDEQRQHNGEKTMAKGQPQPSRGKKKPPRAKANAK